MGARPKAPTLHQHIRLQNSVLELPQRAWRDLLRGKQQVVRAGLRREVPAPLGGPHHGQRVAVRQVGDVEVKTLGGLGAGVCGEGVGERLYDGQYGLIVWSARLLVEMTPCF